MCARSTKKGDQISLDAVIGGIAHSNKDFQLAKYFSPTLQRRNIAVCCGNC